jgi:hypothetical protein
MRAAEARPHGLRRGPCKAPGTWSYEHETMVKSNEERKDDDDTQ